jgi:hypothetical protein
MNMKNLNENEVASVVGGMLSGSILLSRPVHTSLPAIVVLPPLVYTPSPTFDPGTLGQDTND